MDLLLTVALPGQGPETRQDMLVSVQEGTTVADLAWTLHERLGPQPLHAPGGPDAPGGPGAWAPGAAPPPPGPRGAALPGTPGTTGLPGLPVPPGPPAQPQAQGAGRRRRL